MSWQFFIDVGGTFTDVVARTPVGKLITHKLLSTGAIRGAGRVAPDGRGIIDPNRTQPGDFWKGYTLQVLGGEGERDQGSGIRGQDPDRGRRTPSPFFSDPEQKKVEVGRQADSPV